MILILWSSTQPSPKLEGINQSLLNHLLDFAHFPVYFFLAVFLINSFPMKTKKVYILSFSIAVAFGILNEVIQRNVPDRSFSIKDMVVNALAAFLAVGVICCFCKKFSKSLPG